MTVYVDWNNTIKFHLNGKYYIYDYKKKKYYQKKEQSGLCQIIDCLCCCGFLNDIDYIVKLNKVSDQVKKAMEIQMIIQNKGNTSYIKVHEELLRTII
jgi:hypothetical protein